VVYAGRVNVVMDLFTKFNKVELLLAYFEWRWRNGIRADELE